MATEHEGWIETSDVIPMFPTLVWKLQLAAALHETVDAKILAAVARLRRDAPKLAPGRRRSLLS